MTDDCGLPPFPDGFARPSIVWADVDDLGLPRDALAWEATYLRTDSTGMLHAPKPAFRCVRAAATEVLVPLVADTPDTAERCSRCAHYGERPPAPVAAAYRLAVDLKWWADYVAALEARVASMDRFGLLQHRRRGPVQVVVADEADSRVGEAGQRAVEALEARRNLALAKIGRRLGRDTADIDVRLDALVTELACGTARARTDTSFRRDAWALLSAVETVRVVDADDVWRAVEEAWRETLASPADDRAALVDRAIARFAEPPVMNLGRLRDGDHLVPWAGFASPAEWADAEFEARRRRLAETWAGVLDDALAEASELRAAPDRYLVTTHWDEAGPTDVDDLHAILPACPHVTAHLVEGAPWDSRARTAALVRVPAVLARRLHDSWSTFDAGPAEAEPDEPTLLRLLTTLRPGGGA